MKLQGLSAGAAVAFTLLSSSSAFAVTEISWWHAMTGANNEVVETLSKEFNESQSDYKIVPVFKGTYPETLNAGIAAYRAGQAPDIIQIFDAGTGTMMAAELLDNRSLAAMRDAANDDLVAELRQHV